jgi:glutamate carboxypeptidase
VKRPFLILPTLACILLVSLAADSAETGKDQTLWKQVQQARPTLLHDIETLVNIDSPAGFEPGLSRIGEFLADRLRKAGARVEAFATGKGGANIVAILDGSGPGSVLLIGHVDTVFEPGTAAERPFKAHSGRATGPGIADAKSGVALGLAALRLIKERRASFGRVTLLITCDEEIGSPGARELLAALAREHQYALVLESGSPDDGVKASRRGQATLSVEVRGKATHVANEPELGANALQELCHQVTQLTALTHRERKTSVSFTQLRAGGKANVIPELASARADVRAALPEEFDRIERAAQELSKVHRVAGVEVQVGLSRGRPVFPANPRSGMLADKARTIYRELGLELKIDDSAGSSDANYAHAAGAATLDGLGPVGGRTHTAQEFILLKSLTSRLYLLTRLVESLAAEGPARPPAATPLLPGEAMPAAPARQ